MSRATVTLVFPLWAFTIGAALVACGDTTSNPITQLNLDRPVDVAFACYGGLRVNNGNPPSPTDPVIQSPQPTTACDIRSGTHATNTPTPVPPGQEDLTAMGGAAVPGAFWYSFILQQGPGTVVIAQFQTKPAEVFQGGDVLVLDADPLTPGKNGISVGEDPVAIATDKVGCHEVIANAGSCDLSILDIDSVVRTNAAVHVDRLGVTNAAGVPIRSKPSAMVGEPAGNSTIGTMCPATASGLVYIAYPSCHLVAGVDTSTGKIVKGIQYNALGVPSIVDGNVTCPDECGGATGTAGIRPVTMDLMLDPRKGTNRLAIGANNSGSITMVELDKTTSLPTAVSQIALSDPSGGDLGITRIALSPVIGIGGSNGVIVDDGAPGGDSQFVYAVTTDNTVRVADVLDVKKECDTQVDPRFVADIRDVHELACMPVGDPKTPPRRVGANGPGIQVGAIPTGVTFVRADPIVGDMRGRGTPGRLIGYYAAISTATGATFIVNVDDDDQADLIDPDHPIQLPALLAIPHQVRDTVDRRRELALVTDQSVDGQTGGLKPVCDGFVDVNDNGVPQLGPHATANPSRTAPVGVVSASKMFEMPNIRQLVCDGLDATGKNKVVKTVSELSINASELDRYRAFPDIVGAASDETWSIAYEGTLSIDKVDTATNGPAVRQSMLYVDGSGMHLRDQTKPYCSAGVEPFDIVQMRGCDPANGNIQCPRGYRCFVHPESQIAGLGSCIRDDEADRLAVACKDYLTSLRRYTVLTSTSGELQLAPRRHELRTSPVDGCTSDDQCKVLADYGAALNSDSHPIDDTTPADPHTYTCTNDPFRPATTTGKRCELRCDTNADCLIGTICQGAGAGAKSGFCMESIVPPQACVNAPQRYELRAGGQFVVAGTRSGFQHAIVEEPSSTKCVRAPGASPLLTGRLPLQAPPCDPTADPVTGKKPDGTFEPNPCSTTVQQADNQPNYLPGTCTLGSPTVQIVMRDAPAIRFRNRAMNFDLVDPFYPGDSKTGCILDRMGGLGKIPLVAPGFAVSFRVAPGFQPLLLPIRPAFPSKVVRGPTQSIWVVDTGDFLSTSITEPSTRGKVFRVEPNTLHTNVLQ